MVLGNGVDHPKCSCYIQHFVQYIIILPCVTLGYTVGNAALGKHTLGHDGADVTASGREFRHKTAGMTPENRGDGRNAYAFAFLGYIDEGEGRGMGEVAGGDQRAVSEERVISVIF